VARVRTTGSIALLPLALTLACAPGKSSDAPAGRGRLVHAGPVRALQASPDGALLAFLDACQEVKAQHLPPRTARCDLRVAPATGGAATKVAAGVTTLPHGVAWSPGGNALLALADYDHANAVGTLVLWRDGAARPLADGVTFHGFGAHGELGLVAGGQLSVMLPSDAAPRPVAGADQVASFDLAPVEFPSCGAGGGALVRLVARRAYAAGGQLLVAGCDLKEARPLERGQVGDYGFAPGSASFAYTVQEKDGSALKLVRTADKIVAVDLGRGARTFAFGPDGRTVAFVADVVPGKQGNLHLGAAGRKDEVLAREVGEFRWAKHAPRVAWLERYEPRVRSGVLGVGGPGLAPRAYAQNVSELEVSPDGKYVAFLQHTTRGGYSVDLGVIAVEGSAGEKPRPVAQGVFGFAFSPDGRWLYYRARCVRNAEACDLERVPVEGIAEGTKPEAIAAGVKSFEFDPREPGRLLLGWQRMDLAALDVGVWERGKVTSIDTAVLPGSARFLGPDSRRVAYIVAHPKRAGVYVAEVK
jgi:dipeptidyl aminopeptidase/acylaminoacyl peptidase